MEYPNRITGYISQKNYDQATKDAAFLSCSHCLLGLALQDMGYSEDEVNVGVEEVFFLNGEFNFPEYWIDEVTSNLISVWCNHKVATSFVFPHKFVLKRKEPV